MNVFYEYYVESDTPMQADDPYSSELDDFNTNYYVNGNFSK